MLKERDDLLELQGWQGEVVEQERWLSLGPQLTHAVQMAASPRGEFSSGAELKMCP